MIFMDKPYRVGQRVNILGQDGTVESIGLRSTKIRLLSGHLTTIPNEKMIADNAKRLLKVVEAEKEVRTPKMIRGVGVNLLLTLFLCAEW